MSKKNSKTKLHLKTGDQVIVIAGDDKGKEGRVMSIDRIKNRAIVEGVNIVIKHKKPVADETEGGRFEQEAPVHISNLMYVDDSGEATRTGRKRNESGKLLRYSKKSGEFIEE